MAEVTGITYDKAIELTDVAVTGGDITGGELILHTQGGADLNLGPVSTGVPDATTSTKGIVELATDSETTTGTDAVRAVTPLSLSAVTGPMNTAIAGKQAADSDLTAIAALTPTDNDVVQRKSGAWTNRTMAQLAVDIGATGEFPDVFLHNGTSYVDADSANVYVGSVDPGSVANGSVWYDTTGA